MRYRHIFPNLSEDENPLIREDPPANGRRIQFSQVCLLRAMSYTVAIYDPVLHPRKKYSVRCVPEGATVASGGKPQFHLPETLTVTQTAGPMHGTHEKRITNQLAKSAPVVSHFSPDGPMEPPRGFDRLSPVDWKALEKGDSQPKMANKKTVKDSITPESANASVLNASGTGRISKGATSLQTPLAFGAAFYYPIRSYSHGHQSLYLCKDSTSEASKSEDVADPATTSESSGDRGTGPEDDKIAATDSTPTHSN